jgi:hypothetical protein
VTRRVWTIALLAILVLGSVAATGAASGEASVIYREVFPNQLDPTGSGDLRKNEVYDQGRYGEQHGSHITGDPRDQDLLILDGNPSPNELHPINSDPQGPGAGTSTGGAYYSRAGRAGIYIFTSEFSFPAAFLHAVRWEARNSTCAENNPACCTPERLDDTDMHLALRMGDTWYASEMGMNVYSPNEWVQFEFALDGLAFETHSRYEPGECQPADFNCLPRRDNPPNPGNPLPAGTIDAFGLYVGKNFAGADGKATMRIDNFQIVAVEPVGGVTMSTSTLGLLAPVLGLVALVALATLAGVLVSRRRA